MSKNKLGARKLSAEEIKLILPTYDQIHIQIDQFRNEKNTGRRKNGEEEKRNRDIDQKTNNIGIIGVRGAGKTSILKTVREDLLEQHNEHKDIVLPIVVPENMSESSTLMATILGMLSDEVDRKDKEQRKGKNEDCIRKSDLRSCCDEVIKQYTYIQKEYRDILIHEYTTDSQYVSSSAKVFNSDTEFIYKFNQLIEKLISKSDGEKNLLFVFIDDIDLSTYRCADVVKTLLSYLSNENIVTLISGDLETFEEALTLDFLRQEKVLDRNILRNKIGSKPVLDSKKQLAYEYMKKILPPVYRHNIKHWSLEERANYYVTGEENGQRKQLSVLLEEALADWVDPEFFSYMESGLRMPLPYAYSLFDSTSRGLNNVYNVLSDIAEERKQNRKEQNENVNFEEEQGHKKKPEERKLEQKKMLLDTIVSSKATYNNHREKIQKRMFTIGFDSKSSKVFFDNACSIIYKEKTPAVNAENSNPKSGNKAQVKKTHIAYEIGDAAERFALFLLVDFAARLLYEKEYEKITSESEYYINLKNIAMEDFFFHPEVAEKVLVVDSKGWKDEEAIDLSKIEFNKLSLERLNKCFLLKGDLPLNLAYYKNLPLEKVLELYQDNDAAKQKNAEKKDTVELRQSIIIALWKALTSVAALNVRDVLDQVAEYYPIFTMEFLYIRNQLSDSKTQNEVMRLFDGLWDDAHRKEPKPNGHVETWEERQKEQQIKRIIMNTIAQCLKKENDDSIKEEWEEYADGDTLSKDGKPISQDDITKRITFLKAIDSGRLWGEEAVEVAVTYLKNEIGQYLKEIYKNLYCDRNDVDSYVSSPLNKIETMWNSKQEGEWRLDTSVAFGNWKNFYNSDDGKSYTRSKQAKDGVQMLLAGHSFKDKMPYAIYDRIIGVLKTLATNYRVRYGRAESQRVLDSLQFSYAVPESIQEPNNKWGGKSYFTFLLQCYYKYKRFTGDAESISQDAALLAEIAETLSDAYLKSDEQIMNTFIERLNVELEKTKPGEKIDIKQFEEIFS